MNEKISILAKIDFYIGSNLVEEKEMDGFSSSSRENWLGGEETEGGWGESEDGKGTKNGVHGNARRRTTLAARIRIFVCDTTCRSRVDVFTQQISLPQLRFFFIIIK